MKLVNVIFGSGLVIGGLCHSAFAQDRIKTIAEIDVSAVLKESSLKIRQANFIMVSDYAYKFRRTVIDRKGKTTSKLFESYFPSRFRKAGGSRGVVVQLEENGIPLPVAKIEKQRMQAAQTLGKEADVPEEKSSALEDERKRGIRLAWIFNVGVDPSSFLEACKFGPPTLSALDGRKVITMEFDQCDASKLEETESHLPKIKGRVWFDLEDRIPVRLDAWDRSQSSVNSSEPKVLIRLEHKRVAEGVWLPALINVEGLSGATVFPKLKMSWKIEFFDYKRLETEVRDVKLGPERN